jgi:hypothetical protein
MAFVLANESPAIANHSFRSYLFARLLARRKGMRPDHDFGDELLYLVCVLHDLGLTEHANGKQRFEVDGADAAVEFLSGQGVSSSDIDVVWQAIALHTSGGIAERRGPICQLTRGGAAAGTSRATGDGCRAGGTRGTVGGVASALDTVSRWTTVSCREPRTR